MPLSCSLTRLQKINNLILEYSNAPLVLRQTEYGCLKGSYNLNTKLKGHKLHHKGNNYCKF